MPAETHSHRDDIDVDTVVGFLANVLELDEEDPGELSLDRLGIDDDLAMLDLWDSFAEEFGERTLGEFEAPEQRPTSLGGLAAVFHETLGG